MNKTLTKSEEAANQVVELGITSLMQSLDKQIDGARGPMAELQVIDDAARRAIKQAEGWADLDILKELRNNIQKRRLTPYKARSEYLEGLKQIFDSKI